MLVMVEQPAREASHVSRSRDDLRDHRPSLSKVVSQSSGRVGPPVRDRRLQPTCFRPAGGCAPFDAPTLAEAEEKARRRPGSGRFLRESDRFGVSPSAGRCLPSDLHPAGDVRHPFGLLVSGADRPEPFRRQFLRLPAGRRAQIEEVILDYGVSQGRHLASQMTPQSITACEDETFHPQVCLVSIEPVSDFILLEVYCQGRDATSWTTQLTTALEGLPVEVVQVTSDEAKGLLAHAREGLGAHHSPDLFHVQHEVSKATSLSLRANPPSPDRPRPRTPPDPAVDRATRRRPARSAAAWSPCGFRAPHRGEPRP